MCKYLKLNKKIRWGIAPSSFSIYTLYASKFAQRANLPKPPSTMTDTSYEIFITHSLTLSKKCGDLLKTRKYRKRKIST